MHTKLQHRLTWFIGWTATQWMFTHCRSLQRGERVAGRLSSEAALLEEAASRIGSEREVIAVPTRVREYDSALSAFGIASDQIRRRVQERDRAQSALRESEARWRSISEALPNLVWTDLPDGQCDWLSSQWGKYTGIPEQELLGLEWLNRVIHPDDRERTLQCWQAACEDRGDYDLEYRIRRYDGQYPWFKTRGVPLRDISEKIVYWFGVPTVNPTRLTIGRESGDSRADGQSLQVDLVHRGRAVPIAYSTANGNSRPSTAAHCAAAEIAETARLQQYRSACAR